MTRTIKLTLAYDGTRYHGWQLQANALSVQEVLDGALAKLTGETVRTLASGRTDTGVHAIGQVASFRTNSQLEPAVFVRALNATLPDDIAIRGAEVVPLEFHPIRDCIAKRYVYLWRDAAERDVFSRNHAWQVYPRLDEQAMNRAAQSLAGTHDFAAFQSSGAPRPSTVRTVTRTNILRAPGVSLWHQEFPLQEKITLDNQRAGRDFVILDIAADGFLYNMVRAIAGTLTKVGHGLKPENWPGDVLASRDRNQAGVTAPPHGLFLVSAEYGNCEEE